MTWLGRRGTAIASATFILLAAMACKEPESVRVRSLKFQGVSKVAESELRAVLATKQGSWIPFAKKPGFNRSEFTRDLQRIKAFYADRGYPDAKVTAVDADFDKDKKAVALVVTLDEGAPIVVRSVRFEGVDVLPERRQRALPRLVKIEAGMPRNRPAIRTGRETIVNVLREFGYPYADVTVREVQAENARDVGIVYSATPGPAAVFGPVEIRGNTSVSDKVVQRQLTFTEGEPYRQSRVQSSQRRLSSLPLFEFAYVEPRGQETRPAQVPMRVTLTEDKHRQLTASAGYGSEEKARVRAEWTHVNFLGGARQAGLEAKYSSLDRGVRLKFTEPYFFTRHLMFSAQGQAWDENEPVYRLKIYGGRGTVAWLRDDRGFGRQRGSKLSVALTLINEYTDYRVSDEALADPDFRDDLIALGLDPDTGAASGRLGAIRIQADYDTTPGRLDTQRGIALSLAVEQAGRIIPGDFKYTEYLAEARHYLRLGRRVVLANRLRYASIDAPESSDPSQTSDVVPYFKRYFLGGSTSLRGWGRYQVAPLTDSGLPTGGLSLVEGSSEVRFRLTDKLNAVAFVDLGGVGSAPWNPTDDGLRADVGPGLRYQTPVGPVRVDVGYQLTPIDGLVINGEPESRHWRVHISIGQAF
jgi:outer membrane protein insertion porin family/translocation and assembly module TamA